MTKVSQFNIRSIAAQLPDEATGPAWFAFRTGFKREKMVARRLSALDVEHYVPLKTVVRVYPSKRKVTQVPLLSTYIFVRLTAKQYGTVLSDPDVYEIVHFKGEVGRVTNEEIDFLKAVLGAPDEEAEEYDALLSSELMVGTKVIVSGGPLAGTKGVVVDVDGKHNFQVELRSLGLGLVMKIDRAALVEERG